jgi:ADP-heptose:LPS heptosyltransferase
MIIKSDCIHFMGDKPCRPHKESGVHCDDCSHFQPVKSRILLIKLGAIGDVIRSTPLLRPIRETFRNAEITWLTYSPEVLSPKWIDRILPVSLETIEWLKSNSFDWLINLDKDLLAVTLAKNIPAEKKSGFTMDIHGKCVPMGSASEKAKWLTGLWDDVNKQNTKHYMEEIFRICGYEFHGEEYILEDDLAGSIRWDIDPSKKVIGLNTGCGGRWTSRLWPEKHWIALAKLLMKHGLEVILLGGLEEDERNRAISKKSGGGYPGHFDLKTFINLVHQTDLVVTAVTMAMHIAIGLKRKLVLFNNIFNTHEFHLYNRGVILEPELECDCFFSPRCDTNCMESLKPGTVFESVLALLGE